MPRPKAPSPAPSTPVEDPLADLRDGDERYPAQEGPQGAQEGPQAPGEADPLSTLVGEACGAVSVCWDPTPEGVFQSEAASAIVDDLLDAIRPMVAPAQDLTADAAVEAWHANTVALGFLHKGGRCGCRYVAQVILGA